MSTPKVTQKIYEEQRALATAKNHYILEITNQMRTPMNVISGMIDISMNNVTDSHKVEDCLEKMNEANREIRSLVEKIQDMAYLEEEIILDTPQPAELTSIIKKAINKVYQDNSDYYGKINIECDAEHPVVLIDVRHFSMAMTYIISDAIKNLDSYTDITFSIKEKFTTKDGEGMYEFAINRMYGDKCVKDSYESRVSMARAKMILLAMGGSVEIKPAQGYDTIRITEMIQYGDINDIEAEEDEIENIDFWGMRVLVAEDNVLNMQVMEVLLKELGIIVTKAWNGKQAVDIFTESGDGAFDLVILDVKMPEMDGYEAAQTIRALDSEYAKDIIIFTVTAEEDEESVRRIYASGIDHYFLKPVNVKEILKEYIRMTE